MKNRIIFYGDSNTYGYDPRDYSDGRYPGKSIWTSVVGDALNENWEIINEGMNGRRIPFPERYDYVHRILEELTEDDYFAVMLGSNDLLCSEDSDCRMPVRHMDEFLTWLTAGIQPDHILLIAPVYAGSEHAYDPVYRHFYDESKKMNAGFKELAKKHGCLFADASGWGVETAFDMLHFSAGGHMTFALEMIKLLKQLRKGPE